MKIRLIVSVLLAGALSLSAHGFRGGYYGGYYGGYRGGYSHHGGAWVAPLVVGGVLGYALSRPQPVVYQTSPVVVTRTVVEQPVVTAPSYPAPITTSGHYEERWVYFDDCQCQRKVLVSVP